MRYLFEDYALDTDRRELHRGVDILSIAPQVFDLLTYLIRHRDRVVSKDDLIQAIWNGRAVSDAAVTTRLNAARTAIGDNGEHQRLIKTLPRRGFRFAGEVRELDGPAGTKAAPVAPQPENTPSPPRLSIVVLPFDNLSGDPEQDYFADGVTESLTTDLSRISGSFVIGRHTAFAYRNRAVDLKQVGRDLNVRYVLEGALQRAGNRLRVSARLVDAQDGNQLWADRFESQVADLFALQDEIVAQLANTLSTALVEAEARRADHSQHPEAMDLYFQGRAWLNKGRTPEHMERAGVLFERALSLDPDHVEALVGLAGISAAQAAAHMVDDRAPGFAAAEAILTKALSIAPGHALARLWLGNVKLFTKRASQGILECERALALNRNLAEAHNSIGIGKALLGRSGETEAHVAEALRLSPRDNSAYRWLYIIGAAKLQLGADTDAVTWIERSLQVNRNYPVAHFHLAAAFALLGRLTEARAAAGDGLALDPHFTCRRFRANPMSDNPVFLAAEKRIGEGMSLAGVPAG